MLLAPKQRKEIRITYPQEMLLQRQELAQTARTHQELAEGF